MFISNLFKSTKVTHLALAFCCLIFLFCTPAQAQDCEITFVSSPEIGGTTFPSGLHFFHKNQIYTIGVTANSGYQFIRWEVVGPTQFLTPLEEPDGMIKTKKGTSTITAYFEPVQQKVNLTMSASPGNWGTTTPTVGTHQVNKDESVSIQANAASGYTFYHWQATGHVRLGNPGDASTYAVCSGDGTVTAVFQQEETVNLTLSVTPENSGTTTPAAGSHSVAKNTPLEVTAQPADGYHFERWRGQGSITIADPNQQSTIVSLSDEASLLAVFRADATPTTVTMTVSPENGGTTSPAVGQVKVDVGEPVPIHADANPGYTFVRWKATGPIQLGNPKDSSTTMTVVNAASSNKTVSAIFEKDIPTTTLTIAASPTAGGSTNPGIGKHTVEVGHPVEIVASPLSGYHFVNWTIDGQGTLSSTSLVQTWATLSGNATVTANFAADTEVKRLTMAASPATGGTTNPGVGAHLVYAGQTVAIEAVPADGYHFFKWSVTGNATISDIGLIRSTVLIHGNATVTANFKANTTTANVTMALSPPESGTTNPAPGVHSVYVGQTIMVEAIAAKGYYFNGWQGKGKVDILEPDLLQTPVLVKGDGDIVALFKPSRTKANLTISSFPANSGSTNPGAGKHIINSGQPIAVKAIPKAGYYFKGWLATGRIEVAAPNQRETVVTLSGDGALVATFKAAEKDVQLTVSANPANAGVTSPSGTQTVMAQQYYELQAEPLEGYYFVNWTPAGGAVVSNTSLSQTYVVMSDDGAVVANFAPSSTPAKVTFKTSPANSGYTAPAEGEHSFQVGRTISITAAPQDGYHFVNWAVDGQATLADATLIQTWAKISGDATITANFAANTEQKTLTLAVSPENSGTTNPGAGAHTVNVGQTVTIEAAPADGFHFSRWSVSGDATIADIGLIKTTVLIHGDATVTANFMANTTTVNVTISTSPQNGGHTTPAEGVHAIHVGQTIMVEAIAASGYFFNGWTAKGKVDILESDIIRTPVFVKGEGEIIALFKPSTTQVTLSIAALPLRGGSTNPGAGDYKVNAGEPIAIEAKPTPGYYFKNWITSGGAEVSAPNQLATVTTLSANGAVIAIFEVAEKQVQLTVKATPAEGGVTSPSGTQTVNANQYYEIQAQPADGFHFVNWTAAGGAVITNTNLSTSYLAMSANGEAVANFAKNSTPATITFAVDPSGSGFTDPGEGEHNYQVGQTITLTATALNGFHFIEWQVSGDAAVADFSLFETQLAIKGDATVTAHFGTNTTEATVTMKVNGEGATLPATGSYTTHVGETRRILAVPAEGYHFVNWTATGAVKIADPDLLSSYITIAGNATVTANVQPNTYTVDLTLSSSPQDGGTLTPAAGFHELNALQPYSIQAVPKEGYYFLHWDTEGKGIIADINLLKTVVVLWGDATITAVFQPVTDTATLTMQVTPENSGTTAPAVGAHTVNQGQTLEIEATPISGFHFVNWQLTGSAQIGNLNIYKTNIVLAGDATVTANFAADTTPLTLTMAVSPADGGATNPAAGNHTVHAGETLAIEATAASGYHFVQWTLVGNGSIANKNSFETTAYINRDSTIIAHFAANSGTAEVSVDSLPADGGATTPGSGTYEASIGKIYNITAKPAAGYYFLRWETTGNLNIEEPTSAKTSVAVLGSSTLTAEFAKAESEVALTMQVTPANAGATNPAPGSHSVYKNQPQPIEALANTGYYFVQWLPTDGAQISDTSSATTTATLTRDATIIAQFAKMDVNVTLTMVNSPENAGTTSPTAGSHQMQSGQPTIIKATPATGYRFLKWGVNGNINIDDVTSSTAVATVNGNGTVTANFIPEGEGVILTLLVENNDGGVVIPWHPTFVKKGEPVAINEVPFDGFVFIDWTVNSGQALVTYSEETGTTVTCQTDSTLTAKFVPVVKPTKTRLTVKYGRKNLINKETKSNDLINLGNGVMTLATFDPDKDTVNVIAANQTFDLNSDSGIFTQTQRGYHYDSNDKLLHLKMNFKKATWTFNVHKTLLENPDFDHGIAAVLIVNNQYFGANYQVTQNSHWKYQAKQNGTGEELLKNGMSEFDITHANGSYVSNRKRPLNINIKKATFTLADGYIFDPENDSVLIYIDNVFFPIVPGSFVQKRDGVFEYNDRNRNSRMKLDFNKKTWSLKLRESSSFEQITYKDGLDIYVVIGNAEAGIRLKINFNNTFKF